MNSIKEFAFLTMKWNNNENYSEWNFQDLILHSVLLKFFPEWTRSTIDDNKTFCICRKEDDLGNCIYRFHPKIIFAGDFDQCIDYLSNIHEVK
jgi:hypothetical protein